MPSQTLRRLAGATALMSGAVALAFSATSNAAGFIDTDRSVLTARVNVDNAIAKAAPNDKAPRLAAGGFMKGLEEVLNGKTPDAERYSLTGQRDPATKEIDPRFARTLVYPKDNSTNMLVIAAVLPPRGSEHLPVAVCAQKDGQVAGAWNINADGSVVQRLITKNAEGSNLAACAATIVAARKEINTLAQSPQPAQPSQ